MTTKLAYTIKGEIDYDSLEFNPDVKEPLPDAMFQEPYLEEIIQVLGHHLTSLHPTDNVFYSSNTFICYDPNNLNTRVGPDFYVALGVEAPAIRRRRLYLPWEAGKPPDLALEIASETTARHDVTAKRDIYARIGVGEYWRFDGTGGEYYGEPLAGERLTGGEYQPMALTTEPDGVLKGYSPTLGLSLCWRDGLLAAYDHRTGNYLANLREMHAALEAERAAREAVEARVRELERERQSRNGGD